MRSGISALKKNKVLSSIALVCLADGVVGVSYGAVSVAAGLELWLPLTLAILVLAGASEFLFVGILAAGGSPLMAALAGLLVNIRLLPFGLSVQQQLGSGPLSYFGCHLLNDESVVFAVSQSCPVLRSAKVLFGSVVWVSC
ncbi:MAG: AzlC family ABC transporter permease [Pseudomonadales bacterium]|nr:AzlC family ABC transporter permease [Pseudomonadales bacterium]